MVYDVAPPHGTTLMDLSPLLHKYDTLVLRTCFMALSGWKAMEHYTGLHYDGGIYARLSLSGMDSMGSSASTHSTAPMALGTAAKAMADRVRLVLRHEHAE